MQNANQASSNKVNNNKKKRGRKDKDQSLRKYFNKFLYIIYLLV